MEQPLLSNKTPGAARELVGGPSPARCSVRDGRNTSRLRPTQSRRGRPSQNACHRSAAFASRLRRETRAGGFYQTRLGVASARACGRAVPGAMQRSGWTENVTASPNSIAARTPLPQCVLSLRRVCFAITARKPVLGASIKQDSAWHRRGLVGGPSPARCSVRDGRKTSRLRPTQSRRGRPSYRIRGAAGICLLRDYGAKTRAKGSCRIKNDD